MLNTVDGDIRHFVPINIALVVDEVLANSVKVDGLAAPEEEWNIGCHLDVPVHLDGLVKRIVVHFERDFMRFEHIPSGESKNGEQVAVVSDSGEINACWVGNLDFINENAVVRLLHKQIRIIVT